MCIHYIHTCLRLTKPQAVVYMKLQSWAPKVDIYPRPDRSLNPNPICTLMLA